MKRTLSIILVLTLALSAFGMVATAEAKPKLQIICPSNVQDFPEGVTENNNFIVNYWAEQTGFDFEVVVLPSTDAAQKLNLMFNAGEIYGMVFEKDMTALARFQSEGLLQPFDDYMADSSFFQDYAEYQTKGIIDGKQYGAVILPDGIPCAGSLYVTRKDVLANIGIDQAPSTFEEFNSMLDKLKADTGMIPLAAYGSPAGDKEWRNGWDMVMGMYGLNHGHNNWCVRDGKVTYRLLQPQAYDYLVYAKSLYDSGMIPKDFLSLTEDAAIQLFLSETAASINATAGWGMPSNMDMFAEKGFDARYMDYPSGPDGETTFSSMDRIAASQMVFLSTQAKNPQDYVAFLDFLAKPETLMVCNFGLEGVHYNKTAEGKIEVTEEGNNIQWAVYYRNMFLPDDWYQVYGVNAKWAEYYYPTERNAVGYEDFDPVEFMPQTGDNVTLQNDLFTQIIDQYFSKAVMGEVELTREGFDAMAAEWRAAGGQSLEDIYTEQYVALGSPDFSGMYVTFLPADHPEYTGKYLWNGADDLATQATK